MRLEGLRAFARKVLPAPVVTAIRRAKAAPPPPPPAEPEPWSRLRKAGLRVDPELRVFAKTAVMEFEPPAQLNLNADVHLYRGFRLGAYSFIRSGTLRNLASVGRYTSIGPRVLIGEAEHPVHWLSTTPAQYRVENFAFYPPEADAVHRVIERDETNIGPALRGRVTIGNDVWIGANVIIRRGITIGDGAVVGAGAFVNRDVPPYAIVAGVPARQIRTRFDEALIERLLAVKWWEFHINDLAGVDFTDVEAALDEIERREAEGSISRVPVEYSRVKLGKTGFTGLRVHPSHAARAAERLARLEEQRRAQLEAQQGPEAGQATNS
jgi:acetyltransferase-like isoleucine patch superfamily enzyme